ncbi:MAG: DUF523 and DUF1722 domain-containing protein [Gemmatimonadota bacterium]
MSSGCDVGTVPGAGTVPGTWPRPILVVSACLEFEACRYDGRRIPCDLLGRLVPHVTYRPICPEVEIGLGVPRDPIQLVDVRGRAALIQPATGRDLTSRMERFAERFLHTLGEVDGFLLKSRSPSCGLRGVRLHRGPRQTSAAAREATDPPTHDLMGDRPPMYGSRIRGPRAGLFAQRVLEFCPDLAIEEEGRLSQARLREHFLTKLFALARLRRVAASGRAEELVGFHSAYRHLLLTYSPGHARALERLAAGVGDRRFRETVDAYRGRFARALRRPPRPGALAEARERTARLGAADPRDLALLTPYPEDLMA